MIIDFKEVLVVWPGSELDQQHFSGRLNTETGTLSEMDSSEKADHTFAGSEFTLTPGLCELDAQFREPGTENSESIRSGLECALAGGFHHVLMGPETEPCIDNKPLVKFALAEGHDHAVQLLVKGAVTNGLKKEGLAELFDMFQSGASAFGQNTRDNISTNTLLKALQYSKSFGTKVFISATSLNLHKNGMVHEGKASLYTGLKSIPTLGESINIDTIEHLVSYTQAPVHISGLSSALGVQKVAALKAKFPDLITCDVAIWNLIFSEDKVLDFDTDYKFFPPLRSAEDRQALIAGINDGTIDCITSSHHPWEVEYKKVEFDQSEFGSIALQSLFSLYQQHLKGDISMSQFVTACSIKPREILNLDTPLFSGKGESDFVLWNNQQSWVLNEETNYSRSQNTPLWNQEHPGRCVFSFNKGKFGVFAE